ncbi:hypothetical protein C8Q80DRAFT_893202 [Daedaleopsis nitida]|nr:hypothetical protein C8Q80DRAFT_893202 [Daedaleopsis nitida]
MLTRSSRGAAGGTSFSKARRPPLACQARHILSAPDPCPRSSTRKLQIFRAHATNPYETAHAWPPRAHVTEIKLPSDNLKLKPSPPRLPVRLSSCPWPGPSTSTLTFSIKHPCTAPFTHETRVRTFENEHTTAEHRTHIRTRSKRASPSRARIASQRCPLRLPGSDYVAPRTGACVLAAADAAGEGAPRPAAGAHHGDIDIDIVLMEVSLSKLQASPPCSDSQTGRAAPTARGRRGHGPRPAALSPQTACGRSLSNEACPLAANQ